MGQKVIHQLLAIRALRIQCPHCDEEFPINQGRLFSMYDSYPPRIQAIIRDRFDAARTLEEGLRERKKRLSEQKKTRPEKIRAAAVGSNFGKIAEQIIPAFVTFPYKQTECRPLFEPVDYVIFNGLAKRGRVETIKFVDVKTGDARLSAGQRQIRDRVSEGKVKHRVIGR